MGGLGKYLVVIGLTLAAVGLLILVGDRVPWLGRLPGDLTWRKGNVTLYLPLMTSLLVSVLLTLVLWLVRR